MTDVLTTLHQRLPTLSRAERVIAERILADPTIVIESTITALAAAVGSSAASVARMCRAAGFGGYKEFRLAVASAHSRDQVAREHFQVADADISVEDSLADVVAKVALQESRAIEDTARSLDLAALEAAADALGTAARVDVFGVASSALTAQDLQQKLHRLGIAAFAWSDVHLALTSVAITTPGSVVIGVSHSGDTLETHQVLTLARQHGATTIAITNHPDSPVAAQADVVLGTAAREARFRTGAMSSRIAQMAIVDFLVVRLVQRDFAATEERLRASHAAVQPHRLRQG